MKRILLTVLAVVALASTAQAAVGVALGPYGPIQLRRNWGGPGTTQVDSTQFLLKRGTSDGTASGLRDTLNVINISNWNRFPIPGQGGAAVVIGTLWVTFNNSSTGGSSGDSLGVELQFSVDGTNFTGLRTAYWYVQTAGTAVAAVPIIYDADANVSMATGDIGQANYMRVLLLGDSAGKQVISSVYETHYDVRQPAN